MQHWVPTAIAIAASSIFFIRHLKHRSRRRNYWKVPRNVVITGSTNGIGLAMARCHLNAGDFVVISGRSQDKVDITVQQLELQYPGHVFGKSCDVSDASQLSDLANFARENVPNGIVHIWINNAGISEHPRQHLIHSDPEQIVKVVETNLIGVILGTQTALKLMHKCMDSKYPELHHIFNMDGAGSNGMSTARFAVYGATKHALPQFMKSIVSETKKDKLKIGVHTISPGMVMTDLLLGYPNQPHSKPLDASTRRIFEILAEHPATTSKWLVEQIRNTYGTTGTYPKYLTLSSALWKFLTSPFRSRKFFAENGQLRME